LQKKIDKSIFFPLIEKKFLGKIYFDIIFLFLRLISFKQEQEVISNE